MESQGVIPFLKIANDVTVAINRSGKRRGATCAYLEAWHYDIEDFIDLRRNTGDERRRTHDMDTAIWVPDLFMKRVMQDKDWTLFSPDETPELHHIYGSAFEKRYEEYEKMAAEGKMKIYKTMKAKDLWRKILIKLYETGHPWMTFKDPSQHKVPAGPRRGGAQLQPLHRDNAQHLEGGDGGLQPRLGQPGKAHNEGPAGHARGSRRPSRPG